MAGGSQAILDNPLDGAAPCLVQSALWSRTSSCFVRPHFLALAVCALCLAEQPTSGQHESFDRFGTVDARMGDAWHFLNRFAPWFNPGGLQLSDYDHTPMLNNGKPFDGFNRSDLDDGFAGRVTLPGRGPLLAISDHVLPPSIHQPIVDIGPPAEETPSPDPDYRIENGIYPAQRDIRRQFRQGPRVNPVPAPNAALLALAGVATLVCLKAGNLQSLRTRLNNVFSKEGS